jgi:DNA-binding CsgD family transcriptional regulator
VQQDAQFTKLTAELITVAKGFCDYGEGKGLLTPDGLKFAITKRKEVVRQLSEAGTSQREIASLLGVNASTVNRDLNGGVAKRNGSAAKRNIELEPEDEEDDAIAGEPIDEGRLRAVLHNASEALRLAHQTKRKLDLSEDSEIDLDIVQAARDAASAWSDVAQSLARRRLRVAHG